MHETLEYRPFPEPWDKKSRGGKKLKWRQFFVRILRFYSDFVEKSINVNSILWENELGILFIYLIFRSMNPSSGIIFYKEESWNINLG